MACCIGPLLSFYFHLLAGLQTFSFVGIKGWILWVSSVTFSSLPYSSNSSDIGKAFFQQISELCSLVFFKMINSMYIGVLHSCIYVYSALRGQKKC